MEFQPHRQDDWSIISKENKTKIEDLWKELEPNNLEIPNTKEEYPCSEIKPGTWVLYYARNRAFGSTSYKLGRVVYDDDADDVEQDNKIQCKRDDMVFIDTGGMSGIAARYVRRMKAIPEERVEEIINLFREAGDERVNKRREWNRYVRASAAAGGGGGIAVAAGTTAAGFFYGGARKQKKRITKKRRKGRFTKKSNRKYNRKGNKSKRRRRK